MNKSYVFVILTPEDRTFTQRVDLEAVHAETVRDAWRRYKKMLGPGYRVLDYWELER